MGWLLSLDFLIPFLLVLVFVDILMFVADGESHWERPKWFKRTYITLFVLLLVSFPFLALNLKGETVYATDWKQIYQNDKDIDLTLALDKEFKYKIPLNTSLTETEVYAKGDNLRILNSTHYLTLQKDGVSIARQAHVTELVGKPSSTTKIVKIEYRKIEYTYNRLFNLIGSHEKSDYDGELRLTFDNGTDSATSYELVNLLEK